MAIDPLKESLDRLEANLKSFEERPDCTEADRERIKEIRKLIEKGRKLCEP